MASHGDRHQIRGFLGTILVGVLAVGLTASELAYGWGSRPNRATVREAVGLGYRAAGAAKSVVVEHEVAGRTVVARLTTWFHPLGIRRGDIIAIRTWPRAPTEAALDDFFQLHIGSVAAWLLLAAVAFGEASARAERRRMGKIATALSSDPVSFRSTDRVGGQSA